VSRLPPPRTAPGLRLALRRHGPRKWWKSTRTRNSTSLKSTSPPATRASAALETYLAARDQVTPPAPAYFPRSPPAPRPTERVSKNGPSYSPADLHLQRSGALRPGQLGAGFLGRIRRSVEAAAKMPRPARRHGQRGPQPSCRNGVDYFQLRGSTLKPSSLPPPSPTWSANLT